MQIYFLVMKSFMFLDMSEGEPRYLLLHICPPILRSFPFYIAFYTWSTLASSSDILSLMNFFQSCLRTEEPSGPKSVSPVLLGAKISISFRLLKYIMAYMCTIKIISKGDFLTPPPPCSVPKKRLIGQRVRGSARLRISRNNSSAWLVYFFHFGSKQWRGQQI